MKKFSMFLMLLSLTAFALTGCPADKPATDGADTGADTGADG